MEVERILYDCSTCAHEDAWYDALRKRRCITCVDGLRSDGDPTNQWEPSDIGKAMLASAEQPDQRVEGK